MIKNSTTEKQTRKLVIDTQKFSEQSGEEVLSTLRSSRSGLSEEESAKRFATYGANKFVRKKKFVLLRRIVTQLKNPIVLILLVSGTVLYFIGGYNIDATVIFAALVINLVITLLQEKKVSRAFEVLHHVDQKYAQVLRGGNKVQVTAEKLVPGDIVLFEAGANIPADVRILEENNLRINESILTGEWMPVHKKAVTLVNQRHLAEQVNMAWRGTTVVAGTGCGVVVQTGANSAVGVIADHLHDEHTRTPLYLQIQQLAQWIMVFVILSVLLIFCIALLQGVPLVQTIITAIAIAIAGIPSGLPAAITVVLVVGMQSVLKSNGLVRNLLAAETLGSTTWILTDKTGTLTNGQMTLSEIITADTREAVNDTTISPFGRSVVLNAYMATDGKRIQRSGEVPETTCSGSSVEQALVAACEAVCTPSPSRQQRVAYIPFDSRTTWSAALVRSQGGSMRSYIVGAPEAILRESKTFYRKERVTTLTTKDRKHLEATLSDEGEKGRRVIAIGFVNIPDTAGDDPENYLTAMESYKGEVTFVAFLSLEDTIRDDVPESITYIRNSHINLTMVTGDNEHTARYIAKRSGIVRDGDSEEVLLGDDVRKLSDEELLVKARTIRIFARMLPDQKSRLLRTLLESGEVVAMTGDGINDAPALHRASIGIAVASGTDVAKEASDLILLKNSFSTITASIVEGKKIIQNLKKIVIYLLSTSFSEAILVAGGLLATAALPILPVQILWANIVEEAFIAFAFAFERSNADVAGVDPRDRKTHSVINKNVRYSIFTLAVLTGLFLLGVYMFLKSYTSLSDEQIQTVMFIAVSVDSIFLALSLKQLNKSIFNINIASNWWLIASIVISILIMVAAFVTPALSEVLSLTSIPMWAFLVIPVSALFHIMVIETIKSLLFEHPHAKPA